VVVDSLLRHAEIELAAEFCRTPSCISIDVLELNVGSAIMQAAVDPRRHRRSPHTKCPTRPLLPAKIPVRD